VGGRSSSIGQHARQHQRRALFERRGTHHPIHRGVGLLHGGWVVAFIPLINCCVRIVDPAAREYVSRMEKESRKEKELELKDSGECIKGSQVAMK
jgi:hypothetical protein